MDSTSDLKKLVNIAIVDDSSFGRKSIAKILEEEQFSIAGEAANAQEALALFQGGRPNLFIIDVVMPDMSGIDLAKEIKGRSSTIHIIMISSLAQERIIIESISAGAEDFLEKPFSNQVLINSILKIAQTIKDEP